MPKDRQQQIREEGMVSWGRQELKQNGEGGVEENQAEKKIITESRQWAAAQTCALDICHHRDGWSCAFCLSSTFSSLLFIS